MAAHPLKSRLIGFKVYAILLNTKAPWLRRTGDGQLTVRLGPLGRHLRISSSRLKDQLSWLQGMGLAELQEVRRGEADLSLPLPPAFFQ
jgi:hypothetical protein